MWSSISLICRSVSLNLLVSMKMFLRMPSEQKIFVYWRGMDYCKREWKAEEKTLLQTFVIQYQDIWKNTWEGRRPTNRLRPWEGLPLRLGLLRQVRNLFDFIFSWNCRTGQGGDRCGRVTVWRNGWLVLKCREWGGSVFYVICSFLTISSVPLSFFVYSIFSLLRNWFLDSEISTIFQSFPQMTHVEIGIGKMTICINFDILKYS